MTATPVIPRSRQGPIPDDARAALGRGGGISCRLARYRLPLLLTPDGRQAGRGLVSTYVLAGLLWIGLTAALLLLVSVSAHAAIVFCQLSAAVAGDLAAAFFCAGRLACNAVAELVGLSGGANRGGDSQVSASNKGMRARQPRDGEAQ